MPVSLAPFRRSTNLLGIGTKQFIAHLWNGHRAENPMLRRRRGAAQCGRGEAEANSRERHREKNSTLSEEADWQMAQELTLPLAPVLPLRSSMQARHLRAILALRVLPLHTVRPAIPGL